MNKIISEIQITPIKPNNGLVGFASFVLWQSLYCGSVAIMTRPSGGYRLLYPTKKVGTSQLDIFYPVNHDLGSQITEEVIKRYEEVTRQYNGRYDRPNITAK